jgi:AcrR family transcriptional regulator
MSDLDERILRKISVVGEKRGMERRLRIIRAAIDSLSTVGIQDTTFDAVGKIAKMQRSHVAYYFKTHEELLNATIRFVIASAQEVTIELTQKAEAPEDRVSGMVRGAFEQAKRYPKHAMVLTLLWNLATLDPKYRLFHTELRHIGAERVEHVLELLLDNKKVKQAMRRSIAKTIQAITFGYLLEALSTNSFASLEEAEGLAVDAVARYLNTFPKKV